MSFNIVSIASLTLLAGTASAQDLCLSSCVKCPGPSVLAIDIVPIDPVDLVAMCPQTAGRSFNDIVTPALTCCVEPGCSEHQRFWSYQCYRFDECGDWDSDCEAQISDCTSCGTPHDSAGHQHTAHSRFKEPSLTELEMLLISAACDLPVKCEDGESFGRWIGTSWSTVGGYYIIDIDPTRSVIPITASLEVDWTALADSSKIRRTLVAIDIAHSSAPQLASGIINASIHGVQAEGLTEITMGTYELTTLSDLVSGQHTITPVQVSYHAGEFDLDGDGRFTQLDATYLVTQIGLSASSFPLKSCDLDNDDLISSGEATTIQSYIDAGGGDGLLGDLDGDGDFDCADFTLISSSSVGYSLGDTNYALALDANLDGETDLADLAVVNTAFLTADFDNSGFVDIDDYTDFTTAFTNGDPSADFDRSGFVDTDDFTAFVARFNEGC